MSQTTRNQVPITSQRNLSIVVPPINEQERVANVLGILDGKIRVNRELNQTLEQIAQAIFKSWFVDFDPVKAKQHIRTLGGNDGQTERAAQAVIAGAVNLDVITTATDLSALDRRLTVVLSEKLAHQSDAQCEQLTTTASQFPDQFVESEIGFIPEGWEVGSMKDCCLRVESGGTPKRSESNYWNGDIKWLSSKEVRNVIILDTRERITDVGLESSSAKLWPQGSVIVAMYGATAGQICLLAIELAGNQACCALIPRNNFQSFVFLSARRSIESLSAKASGSAQQNLNKSLVSDHRVLISSENVLKVFEVFASSFLRGWIVNTRENVVLAELRDSLLPKLLSGELKINTDPS